MAVKGQPGFGLGGGDRGPGGGGESGGGGGMRDGEGKLGLQERSGDAIRKSSPSCAISSGGSSCLGGLWALGNRLRSARFLRGLGTIFLTYKQHQRQDPSQ